MVQEHGSIDKVFLICKRPFYSKWAHPSSRDFQENDFVNAVLAACSLDSLDVSQVCQIQAACSTGVLALNWAIRELATASQGQSYLLLGLETELNAEKFVAFKKLGALSAEPDPRVSCQPFGQSRSGLVPGEVLVAVLLQSVEDSQIESGDILLRAGVTNCDASRLTDGLETGDFLMRCLERTMRTEDLRQLDFICPHATSTPLNDALEGAVLGRFLAQGEATPWIVPLKQYIGHTLNSSGLWETLLSAFLLRSGFLPALLNPPQDSWAEPLRFVRAAEACTLSRAMKLSIGFGGINSALLLNRVS
jgi:3-oxoacyl-(acyl-carrier-protein) synthase